MSARDRTGATHVYEALCEALFSAWIGDHLPSAGLGRGLSVQHCPEPYLDFLPGYPGVLWVTHNPGRGEDFQQRDAVNTAKSPLVAQLAYADNSGRLANWYAGVRPPGD